MKTLRCGYRLKQNPRHKKNEIFELVYEKSNPDKNWAQEENVNDEKLKFDVYVMDW